MLSGNHVIENDFRSADRVKRVSAVSTPSCDGILSGTCQRYVNYALTLIVNLFWTYIHTSTTSD